MVINVNQATNAQTALLAAVEANKTNSVYKPPASQILADARAFLVFLNSGDRDKK